MAVGAPGFEPGVSGSLLRPAYKGSGARRRRPSAPFFMSWLGHAPYFRNIELRSHIKLFKGEFSEFVVYGKVFSDIFEKATSIMIYLFG